MAKPPSSQITPDQDAIVGEVEVAVPPGRVFRALTNPAHTRWWSDAVCQTSVWEMDARLGGKWRFEASDPSGKTVVNGVSHFIAYGEITELDPPHVLTYTRLGNWHDHPERPSTARWELSATKTGTRSRSRTAASPTNRLSAKTTRVAGRDCSKLLRQFCD